MGKTDRNTQTIQSIFDRLACPQCRAPIQTRADSHYDCSGCELKFGKDKNSITDFLLPTERAELREEIHFWEDHYGDAEYADESPESYYEWQPTLEPEPVESAIEIGCGSGALLGKLKAKVKVGIDPCSTLIKNGKGFVGLVGSATALPFKDASFDLVYFRNSLHHVKDKEKAFAEASRITRPGGRLLLIEPNGDHPQRKLISSPNSLLRRLNVINNYLSPMESFPSPGVIVEYGKNSKLEIEKLKYSEGVYSQPSWRQKLQRLYSRLFALILPSRKLMPYFFIGFRKPAST